MGSLSLLGLVVICAALNAWIAHSEKPNIFIIYADDLGFGNVGWNNPNNPEVITPNLNELAMKEGLILNRHYVHYVCTPSRSSLFSGRLPCHLCTEGAPGSDEMYIPPSSAPGKQKGGGIPENMTCIATKMKSAGYTTHIVGKWNVGNFNENTIPKGRGFDTSMVYFSAANDYFNEHLTGNPPKCLSSDNNIPIVDFWGNDGPLYNLNGTDYEEFIFENELNRLIDNFTTQTEPFFLVYTAHLIHAPQQIPKQSLTIYENDESNCSALDTDVYPGFNNSNGNANNYHCRSIYESMVTLLDTIVGNLTRKLKANGLWNDTLLIFSSDNGGPLQLPCCSANNYPLRGGKHSIWEGGIRGAAFVSGGFLPKHRVGQTENGMIAVADWYTTLCEMVGVDPFDEKGDKHGLPAVEGFNVWPLISGINETSPRTLLPIDTSTLIENNYKFIYYKSVDQSTWGGVVYPNSSSPFGDKGVVGTHMDCSKGCLFDVVNDETEHIDLANDSEDIVQKMNATLNELIKGYYVNNDTFIETCPINITMSCECWTALNVFHGFSGPWCETFE